MTFTNVFRAAFALTLVFSVAHATKCSGTRKYKVTFHMRWTRERFGSSVPSNAHLSPLTAATHKVRFTPFTMFGYADKAVEIVAESGNNAMLISQLRANPMVANVDALSAPTSNMGSASVNVTADASKGAIHASAIAMLAPTPDWIVAFNNVRLCHRGKWLNKRIGPLFAYDAGTEATMGVDQMPRQNIYRIMMGRYRFKSAGYYSIVRV